MADLSDITKYLTHQSALAVYPSGVGQPSVAGCDVRIYEGWPLPDQLELDIQGKMLPPGPGQVPIPRPGGPVANVSIYPMPGAVTPVYQIQDRTDIVIGPSYGIALAIGSDGSINFSGQPKAGEYITLICDRAQVFSRTGATTIAIINALAADAAAIYPGTVATANMLLVPTRFALTVRQGGPGTLGRVTHRQRQNVMVSVWAQTHDVRTALAAAIDNYLKQTIIAAMPDTSQAKFCYGYCNQTDEHELMSVYRRDLVYECEYATVFQFPGYVITSAEVDITNIYGLQPVVQSALAPTLT